ncbi:MAG: 2-iminoacetate synthase ThiH [bacterium]|nr:2-iminoacetate synthase ThiH [bacterium]
MIPLPELIEIINNNDNDFIEELAQKAKQKSIQYFGRTISLYAPLYLADYCDNHCAYCGFSQKSESNPYGKSFKRKKLSTEEMIIEMKALAATGIQNILLLTGDSRKKSPVSYIKDAVIEAKKYFASISIEIYPLEIDEYKELAAAGVDGLTIYQETYDKDRYKLLHLKGKKTDYQYRFQTPERAAKAGIRTISMGVLLGLANVARDVHQLFLHLEFMEKNYPGVEYSLSFPRLIPLDANNPDSTSDQTASPQINKQISYYDVPDTMLIKLISIARLLFPRVGINLSTRERALIRDHAIEFGITRISAASKTTVGGYSHDPDDEHPQFDVIDSRSVDQITQMLKEHGFDPVFTDWRHF